MNVIAEDWPTSRKEHTCDYCGLSIEKGERYCKSFIVDGGMAWGWKSHRFCHEFALAVMRRDRYDWYEGMGSEDFQEMILVWFREVTEGLEVAAQ